MPVQTKTAVLKLTLFKGFDKLIRSLPSLLLQRPFTRRQPFGYLLDRLHPDLSYDAHRCLRGLASRRGVSSLHPHLRHYHDVSRSIHAELVHEVLADSPRAGALRRNGQWVAGVDLCGRDSSLLPQEENDSDWHCCYGKQSR